MKIHINVVKRSSKLFTPQLIMYASSGRRDPYEFYCESLIGDFIEYLFLEVRVMEFM